MDQNAEEIPHESSSAEMQMIPLKVKSLDEVEISPEFQNIIELQDKLDTFVEEQAKDLADWISINFKSDEQLNTVASELNIYAKIRIKKLQLYSQLAQQLVIKIPDFKEHLYLKSHGRLLRSLYKKAIFSDQEMQEKLVKTPQQVGFFLPDEKILPPQKVVKQHLGKAFKQWDNLQANDWELFSHLIGYGYVKNTPSYFLKYDKVDQIIETIQKDPDFIKENLQDSMFSEFTEKVDKYATDRGISPLAFAAYYGSVQCVKVLLENGAEVDKNAVAKTACGGSIEIYELLRERGADFRRGMFPALNFRQHKLFDRIISDYGLYPMPIIDCAASGSIRQIMFCIQNNADINHVYENHGTALIEAAYRGHYSTCEYLISQGADVNLTVIKPPQPNENQPNDPEKLKTKETALVKATAVSDLDIMRLLIKNGASFDCKLRESSLIEICAQKCRDEAARLLLDNGYDVAALPEDKKFEIFRSCIRTQNISLIRILATHGLKPEDSPTAQKSFVQLALDDPEPDTTVIKNLVLYGASVNFSGSGKSIPPLFSAIRRKKFELVKTLVECGAVLTTVFDNDNPLDCAIKQKVPEIIEFLRKKGLTETPKSVQQMQRQSQRPQKKQIPANNQIQNQQNFQSQNHNSHNGPHYPEGGFPPLSAELSEQDAIDKLNSGQMTKNEKDSDGRTPLHVAAMCGYQNLSNILIKQYCDINAKDNHNMTPLHLALLCQNASIAEVLIKRRCLIDEKDDLGRAPIHIAVKNDLVEIVKLLIKYGCNVNPASHHVSTPLTLAVSQDMRQVISRAGGV